MAASGFPCLLFVSDAHRVGRDVIAQHRSNDAAPWATGSSWVGNLQA
jgi:hypothetical protein